MRRVQREKKPKNYILEAIYVWLKVTDMKKTSKEDKKENQDSGQNDKMVQE